MNLHFFLSLSLWANNNLPIGIEMDTQTTLPPIKTFKKRASIKQSNELTEAAYYLPLQAKRVLWLCLMQAYFSDSSQDDDSDVLPLFKVSVSDYVKYFNVATSVASRDVKAGVKALGESTVTFYPKEGEFEEVTRPWLAEAGMKRGRGSWQIEFNYKVMPFLVGLTSQFTTYSLYDCGQLNSVRVIRLYESLCQYRSTGVWITSHDWLCERFMLPASQQNNIAEMKRTFLEPALKKINEKTPLKVSYKMETDGRFLFSFLDIKQ
ncbi:replication initiation protein [Klebsiella aerogenes]|uniref:replication initiation protein n=1 Tax=Enterobacteriaceae TaxID=543 RepID=UPI001C8C03E7|nr:MULTISPECIES: replication initiation protein [Enterobacteriaceae]HCM9429545.1 replication initiation protein [Enterobacter hormaechei subsp. xiangfangensis]HED1421662.1 replication initiation protein [Kluyvera georgiana]MBX9001795.1 replication initiation protein [Klebsiella aerogenes]MCL9895826.1 replication initiation protein [Enterobacter hormaechei]MCM7653756.1 replication initiation protein [Enterobacter hormaechei]